MISGMPIQTFGDASFHGLFKLAHYEIARLNLCLPLLDLYLK